jgi:hypothetical protein
MIAQSLPNRGDRLIEIILFDYGIGPYRVDDLLPGYGFPVMLEKTQQGVERTGGQVNGLAFRIQQESLLTVQPKTRKFEECGCCRTVPNRVHFLCFQPVKRSYFGTATLLEYSIFLKAAIGSEGRINTGCTSLFIAIHELHKHLHARMPNITGKSSAAPAIRRND